MDLIKTELELYSFDKIATDKSPWSNKAFL